MLKLYLKYKIAPMRKIGEKENYYEFKRQGS